MLNDLLRKSKDFVVKNVGDLKNKKEEHDKQVKKYNELIHKSQKLMLNNNLVVNNKKIKDVIVKKILSFSSSINNEKSEILCKLIPYDETILDLVYAKEGVSRKEYYITLTDKYVWVTDFLYYDKYSYSNIKIAEFVVNGLINQCVNINNNAFEIEGIHENVEKFLNILKNEEYRNKIITEEVSYLCGIKPIEEYINADYVGVSIGENKKIVIHNGVNINEVVNLEDINSIDLLIDNSIVYKKGLEVNNRMTSVPNDCHEMSVRFNLTDKSFTINMIKPNALNTSISQNSKIYMDSYKLSKKIINRVIDLRLGGE